jgi:hypothetical protein
MDQSSFATIAAEGFDLEDAWAPGSVVDDGMDVASNLELVVKLYREQDPARPRNHG